MRTLVRWSLSSFNSTTPTPCRAEPSRRMALSFLDLVEVRGVDRLEAGLLDRQAQQAPAGADHRDRRFRAHVALGQQPHAIGANRLDLLHAGDRLEPLGEPLPLRLHLDAEAAA